MKCARTRASLRTSASMEVLFQINGSNKELIVTKDNVVFLIEEELRKLKVDGVLAYFSCVKGEGYRMCTYYRGGLINGKIMWM